MNNVQKIKKEQCFNCWYSALTHVKEKVNCHLFRSFWVEPDGHCKKWKAKNNE